MTFSWTKLLPLPKIQLAFLVLVLFYHIYSPGWLTSLLGLGLICLLVKRLSKREFLSVFAILSLSALFLLYQKQQLTQELETQPLQITSVELIPDSIRINGDQLAVIGRHGKHSYQLFYRLKSQAEAQLFKKEHRWLVLHAKVTLEKAEEVRNFKGFNYQTFLAYQGIYRIGKVEQMEQLEVSSPKSVFDYLSSLRRQAIVHCQQHFPKPMSHYLTGLLFGYLDKSFGEMTDYYSQLGIIHLFALSGMQVGFFLTYFRRLLLLLAVPLEWIKWIELPFACFYAALTGYSISVIRSLVQSQLRHLGIKGLDNLACAFLLVFLWDAHFLMTVGGVLTFSYAFMLTIVTVEELSGAKRQLVQALIISLGMLPLLLFYFSSFNPMSIILTGLLSYLFDVLILPLLCLVFCLSPLVTVSVCNHLFLLLEKGIQFLGNTVNTSLVFGSPTSWQLLLIVLSFAILYDYRQVRQRVFTCGLVITLTLLSVKYPLTNEVTIVDIGQGDSILIRDWRGKTLLIDVGGRPTFSKKEKWRSGYQTANAQKTLIPYLKSRGIHKIDQLLLTHTDADHMGDMEVVAKAIRVKEVLTSQGSLTNPSAVQRLNRLKCQIKVVKAGDQLSIMGSTLQVLYPWKLGDGKNNDSLVLYGKLLNRTFLFTGDLEKEGEVEIIKRYPQLRVDYLKAGHHGSNTSSSAVFLDHLQPKLAFISAGKNNRYHHPSKETLTRLEDRQITYYRTDTQGAIRLTGWTSWHLETVR
ncbi:ComE operon protein 3 [Streptococcus canis]|uniref:ComE operon protein 3 n=1 Tax=Streptococcus canis TaxID=1329 RepID=A0A3P5XQ11_STRCB|nr:DNA internalization-related competence protein ComEC/Rec2 [Streptococcus canis]MDV5972590.1 DNA internalization-related competence protein ComEC/Rec2 [Streptococcus canis]QKG77893.1 DNA internalization-related competence protein ComEC/Rec2 [Streptococcus canis]VDC42823.1 ComE operon protein 3 [Streptococcus canis]